MPRSIFRRALQLPRSKARISADIDDEIAFDIDMRARELVEHGVDEDEARRRASAEFGDLDATRRYCAAMDGEIEASKRRRDLLSDVRADLTIALRNVRRAPGFAVVMLSTLALGIGANTAVYSVVQRVLIAGLPYRDPDRVVRLYGGSVPGSTDGRRRLTPSEIFDVTSLTSTVSAVGAFGDFSVVTYVGDNGAETWRSADVSGGFFTVLGVQPLRGRPIADRDAERGAEPVVVLSHSLWMSAFGGDPSIVGRTISLDGAQRRVIGVMPASFVSPTFNADLWLPLRLQAYVGTRSARLSRVFFAIARLAPGATAAELDAQLHTIAARAVAEHLDAKAVPPPLVLSLRDAMGGDVRPALLIMMGAALIVLVVTWVNLAGLFLSRAVGRRREMAVRAALGAGRGRLLRQLLTESGLFGIAGGALGLCLAVAGKNALVAIAGRVLPTMGDVRIDAGVFMFAVVISLVSGVVFGLLPAFAATRIELTETLGESGRASSRGRVQVRGGRLLVASQIALAAVLLVGAGLLTRTFVTLMRTHLGYSMGSDVLTVGVNLSGQRYQTAEQQNQFFDALLQRIRSMPGVAAAGTVGVSPWNGPASEWLVIDGQSMAGRDSSVLYTSISDGYVEAMHIPVLRGRAFSSADRADAPGVALISESAARLYWPTGNPIGARIKWLGDREVSDWRVVVGVVGDVREAPTEPARPAVYRPASQGFSGGNAVMIRSSSGDAMRLVQPLRRALHELDPTIPLINPVTLSDVLSSLLQMLRLPMALVGLFALLALALAAIGIYSVMAYSVTSRTREIGIRSALGATRADVLAMVVRHGMTTAIIGTVVGLLIAALVARVIGKLLVGVTAHDPVTFATVGVVLLVVTGAACLVPATAASRVNPVEALRE